jgi:hypothetical protein
MGYSVCEFLSCGHSFCTSFPRDESYQPALNKPSSTCSIISSRAKPSIHSAGILATPQQAPASCPQTAPVVSAPPPRFTAFSTLSLHHKEGSFSITIITRSAESSTMISLNTLFMVIYFQDTFGESNDPRFTFVLSVPGTWVLRNFATIN